MSGSEIEANLAPLGVSIRLFNNSCLSWRAKRSNPETDRDRDREAKMGVVSVSSLKSQFSYWDCGLVPSVSEESRSEFASAMPRNRYVPHNDSLS